MSILGNAVQRGRKLFRREKPASEKVTLEKPVQDEKSPELKAFPSITPLKKFVRSGSMTKAKSSNLKIAIIGNCQAAAVGRCIQAINTDVVVSASQTNHLASSLEEVDLSPILAQYDLVLLHPHPVFRHWVDQMPDRIHFIPPIAFPAYHPDLVYITTPEKGSFFGPLGEYNSSLAFYGWLRGMSVSQTLELFTEEVYRNLGFFEYWQSSKETLLTRAQSIGYSLEDLFEDWAGQGCFMHSVNHPKLRATAGLVRMILGRLGIDSCPVGEQFIFDHFLNGPVWPVYPEIGARLGIKGYYLFKKPNGLGAAIPNYPVGPVTPKNGNGLIQQKSNGFNHKGKPSTMLGLEEFVEQSLIMLSQYRKEDLACTRMDTAPYQELDKLVGAKPIAKNTVSVHMVKPEPGERPRTPYDTLPDFHFWRKAVANIPPGEVDPVVSGGFLMDRQTKVATAGSCFAQHISRRLQQSGFHYYVTEKPSELSSEDAERLNYNIFSARFGNIYTARQLLQLFDRAYGAFTPSDAAWVRSDGRYVDPFRPRIEPEGFETSEEVDISRKAHMAFVREMFENLDVLVFTLGLTEAWKAKKDGAAFPLAPGVAGGIMDFEQYEFVNFLHGEVVSDLERFNRRLLGVNKRARILFTVSPVPLIATYENRHVLVSTTYSKSVLRAAAEEVVRRNPNCHYFPSYEIITGAHVRGGFFDKDLRTVTATAVDRVMQLFFKHYTREKVEPAYEQTHESAHYQEMIREAEALQNIICDEEAIEAASLS